MRIIRVIAIGLSFILSASAFADESNNKSCNTIAAACTTAGYTNQSAVGKRFWQDCMQPILLGQNANGVTVIDAPTVKDCRAAKIDELTNELKELQSATQKAG